MGDAADKFGDLHATHDIAFGIPDGLAVLGREQFGQFVHVLVDQSDEAEKHPRPALGIGGGPSRLGCGCGADGGVEVRLIGKGEFGRDLSGCGVEDFCRPVRMARKLGAVDEMPDGLHCSLREKSPRE